MNSMKKTIFLIILLMLSLGGFAQKSKGLLSPVQLSDLKINERGINSAWYLKLNTSLSATAVRLEFDTTGVYSGFDVAFLSRVGPGLGFSHFVEKDGKAITNYSIGTSLLMPTSGDMNLAAALSVSAYKFNLGIGYDFVKDSPFKKNIFLMTGIFIVLN
jgi:hypothetical protein